MPDEYRRVAIAGASGFLGAALTKHLVRLGYRVVTIGRAHPDRQPDAVWDLGAGTLETGPLAGIHAAINLTGETIGQRWSPDVKRRIVDSRTRSTALLARTIASLAPRPGTLINMSAVGVYGDRGDEVVDEDSAIGSGFLADVARQWEDAVAPARDAGVRVVCARTGVVLHPSTGILERLVPIFRSGIGGPIGDGRQWLSWIARSDVISALGFLLDSSLGGTVNVTSPNPATNEQFTRALAGALHRPAAMRVPAFAVRLMFGEMGEETVLGGQRAVPRRLLDTGFRFEHAELADALRFELAAPA